MAVGMRDHDGRLRHHGDHPFGLAYLVATTLIGMAFSLVSTVPGSHVLTEVFKSRSTALGAYFAIGTMGGVAGPQIYVAVERLTGGWRPYWWTYVGDGAGRRVCSPSPPRHAAATKATHVAEAPEQVGPGEMIEGLARLDRAPGADDAAVLRDPRRLHDLPADQHHRARLRVEHLIERGVAKADAATMLSLEAAIGVAVSLFGGWLGERVADQDPDAGLHGRGRDRPVRARRGARTGRLMSVFAVGVRHRLRPLVHAADGHAAEVLRQDAPTSSCSRSCACCRPSRRPAPRSAARRTTSPAASRACS